MGKSYWPNNRILRTRFCLTVNRKPSYLSIRTIIRALKEGNFISFFFIYIYIIYPLRLKRKFEEEIDKSCALFSFYTAIS